MRPEVVHLLVLGTLPLEDAATTEILREIQSRYQSIARPVSDDEAKALVKMFNVDGCFGLASSLMHLIETSPNWPIAECLANAGNEWVVKLRQRAIRGGHPL